MCPENNNNNNNNNNQGSLKSNKNNGYFARRPMYINDSILRISS